MLGAVFANEVGTLADALRIAHRGAAEFHDDGHERVPSCELRVVSLMHRPPTILQISSKSRRIPVAVSTPPAPRPTSVTSPPARSVRVMAFRLAGTSRGLPLGISCGETLSVWQISPISLTVWPRADADSMRSRARPR